MKLSIIRHAHAEAAGANCFDLERGLTEKGRRQSERIGQYFASSQQVPDLVLCSPIRRASQTAEILCHSAGASAPLLESFLSSGMHADKAISELKSYVGFEHLALVGHEPDLSSLLMHLTGKTRLPFKIDMATLICLEGDSLHRGWTLLERVSF